MPIQEDDGSRLTTWAIDNGCELHDIRIAIHPKYGGYGLFNARAIDEREDERRCLFVPGSLVISIDAVSEAAEDSDELADVLNAIPSLPTMEPVLSTFLLYQLYLTRNNRPTLWSTYLDFLPKSSYLPIAWTSDEIDLLVRSHTSISKAVPAKLNFLRSTYDALQSVQGWFNSISWDDYILAESWVASRSIQSPKTDSPILVPILDFANHSSLPKAVWECTDEGIELYRMPFTMVEGEEITIAYDLDRGTGERLYRYGFIENHTAVSKEIILVDPSPPKVAGGNLFRIKLENVNGNFESLSFLTFENWIQILSDIPDGQTARKVKVILPDEEGDSPILAVNAPGGEQVTIDFHNLESLMRSLDDTGTFHYAETSARAKLNALARLYEEQSQSISRDDRPKGSIRTDVKEMIDLCRTQERNLVSLILYRLNSDIPSRRTPNSVD